MVHLTDNILTTRQQPLGVKLLTREPTLLQLTPSMLDGSQLEPETDPQKRYLLVAGILDGFQDPFIASFTKPTRH